MIGEVVVTKNAAGQIVAVTRQDEEGQILSVIAESAPASCLHQIQEPAVNQQLTTEQEPVFWYRPVCDGEMYEGPHHNNSILGKMLREEKPGEWKPLYAAPVLAAQPDKHPDDAAVDALATLMRAKLAKQRAKGYGGWDSDHCTQEKLSILLRGHVDKCDPVDVANFCAFLSARGEGIAPQAAPAAVAVRDAVRDAEKLLRAEAARLERIYSGHGNKWYGFSNEKAAHIEHLHVADALAATPAQSVVLPEPDAAQAATSAVAVPVQMPKPRIYWIEATTQFCIKRGGEVPFASAWEPLYTEQQVRALLATATAPTEPFGYFKAEPFGWTDCGPDDEGAVALYEKPQAMLATGGQAQAVPHQQLTSEIELVLSDQDSKLSPGAQRALKWCLTWVSVPLQLAAPQAQKGKE